MPGFNTCRPLHLPTATASASAKFLASQLPLLHGWADAAAARTLLQVLCRWQTPGARLLAALPLLKQVAPCRAEAADVSDEASFDILDVDVQEAAPGRALVFLHLLDSLHHDGSMVASLLLLIFPKRQ